MLLTNTEVSKLRKAFPSNSSTNIKLPETQLHKTGQSGLGSLLRTRLPLAKIILKPLAKSVLIPLGLTAVASVTEAAIHKKMFGFGFIYKASDRLRPSGLAKQTTLIISNKEMSTIIKIVKSIEESVSLIKDVTEKIKNWAKEQKKGFLEILLGTLGASLLGNLLTDKEKIRASEDTVTAGQDL